MTRKTLVGIAILVGIQASAVALYLSRTRPESRPFASETLSPRPAPALAFERLDGTHGTLAELRGTPVLVHFWATWCPPCVDELPGLLASAARGDIVLLAVSIDDDWDEIRAFFAGAPVPPTIVRPAASNAHTLFGASTLPDTYVVDRAGQIVRRYHGARDWTTDAAKQHLAGMAR